MDGGLDNCCVGRVYRADGAVHHPLCTHDLRSGSQKLGAENRMLQLNIKCY